MAAATAKRVKRIGHLNRTQGFLGAVKLNRKGEAEAVPVAPGDRVFLTEEEIELTEQSHARAEDSPFEPREILHFDPQTHEVVERFVAAPLERILPARRRASADA